MDLQQRARDLKRMGIQNIWLIDPESRAADRWEANSWHPVPSASLPVPGTPIYLDLDWLWKKLGPQL